MASIQKSDPSSLPTGSETDVDVKEVFSALRRSKWLIFISAMSFMFAAIIVAYFSPNIYQTSTTMEIQSEDSGAQNNDIMAMALGAPTTNIGNEIEIIKSRLIVSKALENLNIGTRYFTTKYYKTTELYKDSPFVVKSEFMAPNVEGYTFQLFPLDEERFRLIVEPSLTKEVISEISSFIAPLPPEKKPVYYDQIHSFGERISTPWFIVTIQKIYQFKNEQYSFKVTANAAMYKFIQESLSASLAADQGTILNLSFTDNIPLRAKDILDAVSSSYIQENLGQKAESSKQKLNFIDRQLAAINATLKSSATKLETYKATNIVVDLGEKATLTAAKLGDLESQLYELDMQMGILENVLHYAQTHDDIKGIDVASTQANATVNDIVVKIQAADSLRTSLLVDYTELHPDVIKATEELNSLRNILKESIKSSIRSIQNRKRTLNNIIAKHKKTMESFPEQEKLLAQLTRNNLVNEKIYSYLLEKRAETAIIESSTVSKTRIVDAPLVPEKPIKPNRIIMIIIGFIGGMILGIVIAIGRAFIDNTIKNVEDIENHTSIPLYGAIPFLHSQRNIQPYYEALRVIRTNLEFLQNTHKSKLITVTSSIPSEGKSSTVAELGKIISKGHKKVIIIDMDMRRSTLHEKFTLPNEVGTSTLLTGKNMLDEVIQETKHEYLDIITSGPVPPNAADLLMSPELESILQALLEQYDYVLLDSPPIGLVSDAMIIMRMSDINLIVLKANYSKKDFLKNINRFVSDHQLNAGIILNGMELGNSYGYGYGYGHKYGYSNSYYAEGKA